MFQKAHKRPFIEWGFSRFNRLFLRAHFSTIYFDPPATTSNRSTLFLINHSTWWDPLFIYYMNDQLIHSDGYGMMHEDGIRRFPFFKSIGAYSVNSEDKRHMMASLKYSIELLNAGKTVWIFPQGEEQHLEKRPLQFFSGISYLVQKCPDIDVVPVSLYYSLEHSRKPNAYLKVGDPVEKSSYRQLNRKQMTTLFEKVSTDQLDRLRSKVIQEDHETFIRLHGKAGDDQ
ncbi:lysophospholipid acyltransferase family protein [Halobacillus litoralis]|uniref:lysophospholipid acyltransferase family protein n=1 Tax=Halobacillus litoralis TaxID=45668 RepID=UPI001CFCCACD|nr:lysophospholipid acyltransferase family protein [Halobacillus litoralis]